MLSCVLCRATLKLCDVPPPSPWRNGPRCTQCRAYDRSTRPFVACNRAGAKYFAGSPARALGSGLAGGGGIAVPFFGQCGDSDTVLVMTRPKRKGSRDARFIPAIPKGDRQWDNAALGHSIARRRLCACAQRLTDLVIDEFRLPQPFASPTVRDTVGFIPPV